MVKCKHCNGTGKSNQKSWDGKILDCIGCSGSGEIGCLNKEADRKFSWESDYDTWSDTNLTRVHPNTKLTILKCTCESTEFSVVSTGNYETAARCTKCHKWYIVHSG